MLNFGSVSAFIIPIQIVLSLSILFAETASFSSYAKLLSTSTFMRFQHRRYSSKARKAACTVATSAAFSLWLLRGGDGSYQMPRKKYMVEPADGQKKRVGLDIFLQTNIAMGIPHLEMFHSRATFPKYYLIGECETQSFQITKNIPTLHELFGRKPCSSLPGLTSYVATSNPQLVTFSWQLP